MFEQALAAAGVICLLGVMLWVLRAKGMAQFGSRGGKTPGVLAAVDRLSLGPQHSVHVIRVADRALVVAVSPSGCRTLETLPWKTVEENRRAGSERP